MMNRSKKVYMKVHREIMPLGVSSGWHVPLDATVTFARTARGEGAGICTPAYTVTV